MFAAGLDWISIQRWGRWRSFIFHEYVWRDAARSLHFGERISNTPGLNKYLIEVAPQHTPSSSFPLPDFHTGFVSRQQVEREPSVSVVYLGRIAHPNGCRSSRVPSTQAPRPLYLSLFGGSFSSRRFGAFLISPTVQIRDLWPC